MVKISEIIKVPSVISHENLDLNRFVNGGKIDSRQILEGDIYFALSGRNADGHKFIGQCHEKKMAFAVVNKDYVNDSNYPVIYSEDVEITLGELGKKWRDLHNVKIIGITGTNGKTTTKEMLSHILFRKYRIVSTFKNYNNQQGVPLTLLSIKDDTEIAIVELGTNHPGEIEYLTELSKPDYGIITNIGDGHLEFLNDREGVFNEKKMLFEYIQQNGGTIFKNTDDDLISKWDKGRIIEYGLNNSKIFSEISIDENGKPSFIFKGEKVTMTVQGMLNLKNAVAAAVIAKYLDVSDRDIRLGLSSFTPSDKRYEQVKFGKASILLDCYNANPTSMLNFLKDVEMIGRDYIIILGDMLEVGVDSTKEHVDLIKNALRLSFKKILIFGSEMKEAYKLVKSNDRLDYYGTFEELKKTFDIFVKNEVKIAVKGSRGVRLERLINE